VTTLAAQYRGYGIAGTLLAFVASFCLFAGLLFAPILSDLHNHIRYVVMIHNDVIGPPANFLYYLIVYAGALFRGEWAPLLWAAAWTLSACVAAKYALTYAILSGRWRAEPSSAEESAPGAPSPLLASGFACALLLAFSLPTAAAFEGRWYLGQMPPNVWHNSTTIFLMPFAVALFWVSYRNLREPTLRGDLAIAALCIGNIFAKPSFFFAFAPIYPVMLAARHGLGRQFWLHVWPVALGVACVGVQYYLLFTLQIGNTFGGESQIVIRPFEIWSLHSSNIPISIAASILFPLAYFALFFKEAWRDPLLRYAGLLFLISLTIMSLVSETGPRQHHGNFFWQAYVCNYLLFTSMVLRLLQRPGVRGRADARRRVALAAFGLHVISGVAYIAKMFLSGSIA
jgi:hypothetical protein